MRPMRDLLGALRRVLCLWGAPSDVVPRFGRGQTLVDPREGAIDILGRETFVENRAGRVRCSWESSTD